MSTIAVENKRLVRFGLFKANLRTGEVWRDGTRIHLQDQPFRMLELLLGMPGELVTREELKARLWPEHTYVTEAALNTCATRLRVALEDNAESPLFVETVARRGYRFVAPVEFQESEEANLVSMLPRNGDGAAAVAFSAAPPPRMRPSTVAIVAVTTGIAALLISILGVVLLWHHLVTSPH